MTYRKVYYTKQNRFLKLNNPYLYFLFNELILKATKKKCPYNDHLTLNSDYK